MVKLTDVEASGAEHVVDAKPGQTVMESAVKNNVPGIAADCGGSCACATCRVYVNETWQLRLGSVGDGAVHDRVLRRHEAGLAALLPDQVTPGSRRLGRPHAREPGTSGTVSKRARREIVPG